MQFSKWFILHFWHQGASEILGWDTDAVCTFWKVSLFLNHDPLPLAHSPLWRVALNPNHLLLVDPGATDTDGP